MTPLKKYIRPGVLQKFLRRACDLTESRIPIAIDYDGEVVLVEGAEGVERFSQSDPSIIAEHLQYDAIHSGHVFMRIPDGASGSDIEHYRRIVSFAAFSIQEVIQMETARRSIADEALAKYRELALLHRSVPAINTSLRMRDVVGALINECRRENYPGEVGMVFLSEPGTSSFKLAVQFGFGFGSNLQPVASSELFQSVAAAGKGEIINDLNAEERWDNQLPGLGSMAIIPIVSPNRCEGMLIMASESTGLFEAAHRKSLATLASVAGISVSNSFNFEGVQTLMNAILQALAEAIDSRDPFTAGHSERVAQLAVGFASCLNGAPEFPDLHFSDEELRELYYAGILHDIGKIGIKEDVLTKNARLPDRRMEVIRARFQLLGQVSDFNWAESYERLRIINKSMTPDKVELDFVAELGSKAWSGDGSSIPYLYEDEVEVLSLAYGNLTVDERMEIQRHPAESERILQHIPMQEDYGNILTIIRQHHERMDGSGYPDRLSGDELILQSRLMAIVDIYDAVTQERYYKRAFTRSEAMKILSLEADEGKLDAELVQFFLANLDAVEKRAERVKTSRITHLTELGNMATL